MSRNQTAKTRITVVRHGPLRMRLRLPNAIGQLQALFDQHTFWAVGRSTQQLLRMLDGSSAVVSAWEHGRLVGFGRATSDGLFRAVLWDVVVAKETQGKGLGRQLVESLLKDKSVARSEKVYVMTTKSQKFYEKIGFTLAINQNLLLLNRNKT